MSNKLTAAIWADDFYSQGDRATMLVALAIADAIRDEVGFTYPSIDSLARKARTSVRGVQDAIKALVKGGKLRVEYGTGKNGTNRYFLLYDSAAPTPQPGRPPRKDCAPQPLHHPRNDAAENPAAGCTQYLKDTEGYLKSSRPEPPAASETMRSEFPKPSATSRPAGKKHPEKSAKSAPSADGFKFADWFHEVLPDGGHKANLPAHYRQRWARCFDELVTLDHRDPATVYTVAEWARKDPFWAKNFLSPAKLRERNGTGTKYFDVFAANMPQAAATNGHRAPVSATAAPAADPPRWREFLAANRWLYHAYASSACIHPEFKLWTAKHPT